MKQKERIEKMEKILFNSSKLLEELEEILNKIEKDFKNYDELIKYYYSRIGQKIRKILKMICFQIWRVLMF